MRFDLEEYDFSIGFFKGKHNYVADALSRVSIEELKELNSIALIITRSKTKNNLEQEKENLT